MLNLMQRCRFATLRELYTEAMTTRSLHFNQQQVAIVPLPRNRSNIYRDLIIKSPARIPHGRDTPPVLMSMRPNLPNRMDSFERKGKKVDSSPHSSKEIFPLL